MKNELLVIAASLALVSSMSASVKTSTVSSRELSQERSGLMLLAREPQPNDQRHGRGKDDPKGHKVMQQIAREPQPNDQRHWRGKDDPKGHKVMQQIAREAEPGDDRGRNRGRGRGNDDGKGHKLV